MENVLKPVEVELLARIVSQACTAIGGCDDLTKETIAWKVITAANLGERDYQTLMSIALSVFPKTTPSAQLSGLGSASSELSRFSPRKDW
jgi:hypothetical protein